MKRHPAALEGLFSEAIFYVRFWSAFGPLVTPIQADSALLETIQNERGFVTNLPT
jgi:hypothetical protein